jgi:hypothetical protein
MINEVTLRQFNGYCYIRDPVINVFSSEVSWFEAYNKKVIGIIVYDFTDKDYGFVILGRDQRKVFRCIETSKIFYENESIAKKELFLGFEKYQNDEKEFYIQGDETEPINEFLVPKVPISQLHPYFRVLSEDKRYEAARNLISEIIYSYIDIDGNYIKDFQTTGFNGRLWELFLYIYLHRAHFSIDRTIKVPDYSANFFGAQYFIEAVTINPSQKYDQPYPTNQIDIINLNRDYMPIKYGMALMTKLRKKYWEKDHVKSNPLIFAIHDFHFEASDNNIGSMTWSRTALENYLYGIRPIYEIDENNLINYKLKDTENGIEPIYEIMKAILGIKRPFRQIFSDN